MGDRRFEPHLRRIEQSEDHAATIATLSDTAVVEALAAASGAGNAYLANVLATEATNRMQRARSEVTHLGEGICSLDLDGRILSANPAAEMLLGWSQAELRGQDFDTLCRDGNVVGPRSLVAAYAESLTAGIVVRCDTERFFRRDGTAFDASYVAAPTIRSGQIDGVVLSFHDISTSKHASAKLRESEARYRSLFENNPDFMFATDMAGRVTAVSSSAADIVGFTSDEACGRPFEQFVALQDRPAARALFASARDGKADRAPVILARKDAQRVTATLLVMPMILDGEIVGVYGLAESRTQP